MDNWFYFFSFFVFINHSKDISAFPRISPTSDSTVQQLCHTALVRGMGKICEQYYNNAERITDRVRRSELVIGRDDEGWDVGMRLLRRIPRNVVQECCRRPCNTATLRRYCSRVRVASPRSVNEADTENEGQRGTPNYSNAEEIIFEDIESSTTETTQTGQQLQSVTQISYPDPVPIGDNFNENIFYGQ